MNADFNVVLSPLEEARFGCRTARAKGVTSKNLSLVLDFCRNNRIQFLIARCHVNDIQGAQAMEQEGFFLADTLVYYGRNLTEGTLPKVDSAIIIRPLANGENIQVQAIAEEAFSDYKSHYHADERLDGKQCDDAYKDWANKACSNRDDVHEVLVALRKDKLLAFATLRMNDPQQGEGVLFGVRPAAQGLGIYKALMTAGMHWCAEFHAREMIVSTQINNIAVQKVWGRLGFEPQNYVYTFHKWLDF